MHHGSVSPDIAAGLLELRKRIARAKIPPSKLDETINVATWNVREFGKKRRKKESIHYIAEIMSQFDLIALTELRDKLDDLDRVLDLLGGYWRAVYSDYIVDDQGNHERTAYVFDKRAVVLTGLVAEVDPPARQKIDDVGTLQTTGDWWRKPYMASFRSGNFDFVMVAAHIRWGDRTSDRVAPIAALADWVAQRRSEVGVKDKDFIVAGDFNIPSLGSATYKALVKHGLQMPKALMAVKQATTSKGSERFDQIVHSPTKEARFTNHGGIVDFYRNAAGKPDYKALYPGRLKAPATATKFTFQLSDHFPLWVQIDVDIDDDRLAGIAAGG